MLNEIRPTIIQRTQKPQNQLNSSENPNIKQTIKQEGHTLNKSTLTTTIYHNFKRIRCFKNLYIHS